MVIDVDGTWYGSKCTNGLVGRRPLMRRSWTTDPSRSRNLPSVFDIARRLGYSVYSRIWSAFAWTLASNLYVYDIGNMWYEKVGIDSFDHQNGRSLGSNILFLNNAGATWCRYVGNSKSLATSQNFRAATFISLTR